MVTAPVRRELVRWMQTRGMTERRCLAIAGMSASSLRYQPRPDRNTALRTRIVALAQRHRRYGVGMIHLKLQQAGEHVNYKRVERLYRLEQLHIRRRRRKKIPVSDRQPLIRPGRANEVWSMDFVFDRAASGRTIKCLVSWTMPRTRPWPSCRSTRSAAITSRASSTASALSAERRPSSEPTMGRNSQARRC